MLNEIGRGKQKMSAIKRISFLSIRKRIEPSMKHVNDLFHYIRRVNMYKYMNNTFFHLADISLPNIDYPNDENYRNVLLPQHLIE